ncbi:hypothetical protein CsatB_010184 [Cannabis sativa]
MLLFPVVNEASRVLDEGIVIRPSDLDVASVLRISFPSHLWVLWHCIGGIIYWADRIGPKHIYSTLNKWSHQYGNFYKPSTFLEERVTKGILLGDQTVSKWKARL